VIDTISPVNLQDTRKGTSELKEGLRVLRIELQDHFAEVDSSNPNDVFNKKMWRFVGESKERLDDLIDEVTLADSTFGEVIKYYGEEDKNMSSTEFFGIFKTFVTSYMVCTLFDLLCYASLTSFVRNANRRIRQSPKNVPLWSAEDNRPKMSKLPVPKWSPRNPKTLPCLIHYSRNYELAIASKGEVGNDPVQKNEQHDLLRPHLPCYRRVEKTVTQGIWRGACWPRSCRTVSVLMQQLRPFR
jgi:Formin Homology 2 Domain